MSSHVTRFLCHAIMVLVGLAASARAAGTVPDRPQVAALVANRRDLQETRPNRAVPHFNSIIFRTPNSRPACTRSR